MSLTPAQENEIDETICSGRKIEAIKLYRKTAGVGLKEAKEAVEQREKSLRKQSSHRFEKAAAKAGCFGVVIVVAILSSITFLILF